MKHIKMFREGYYLEVIKTKHSAATAVITVKEKTVDIKNKKITTNKWLTLEDWASLYDVLERALLQNNIEKMRSTEKKKFTRHLEIAYTFEMGENPSDRTSLATIRVAVSALKKKSSKQKTERSYKSVRNIAEKKKKNESTNPEVLNKIETCLNYQKEVKVEEYIPDIPNTKKIDDNDDAKGLQIGYVPSRKSTLEFLQQSAESNEYVPSVINEETVGRGALDALYIPNSIPKYENSCETYEPSSLSDSIEMAGIYIPNSKGSKKKVDEYQPDFIVRNKTMKFDNSYIPSSSKKIKEMKKNDTQSSKSSGRKCKIRDTERIGKESDDTNKKSSTLGQSEIKREM